jgi:hypothetical protein
MKIFLTLIVSLSLISQSIATTIVVSENMNARSSMSFVNRSNIEAVIPKGSEGAVLERRKLPSGSYGIKIRVTRLGGENSNLKIGDEVWVYYHRDASRRVIALYDDRSKAVEPASAKNAVATKTFKIKNQALAKTQKTRAASCDKGVSAQSKGTKKRLIDQINCLKDYNNQGVPEVDVAKEEIVAMIQKWREEEQTFKGTSKDTKIADAVSEYCRQYQVPVALVLAIMSQESNFYDKAVGPYNPKKPNADRAKGLMQLMANTAGSKANRYDIKTNVKLAVKHLKQLLSDYEGDLEKTLIAYNAGTGSLSRYLQGKKKLPKETRNYVPTVAEYYATYTAQLNE